MFSFFRRTPKNKDISNPGNNNKDTTSNVVSKDATGGINGGPVAVQNGVASTQKDAHQKEINKRLSVSSDTCPSVPPTCEFVPSRTDENSSSNVGRRESLTQAGVVSGVVGNENVVVNENSSNMAPMAAFRGKGKGKKKPPYQQTDLSNNQKQNSGGKQQENTNHIQTKQQHPKENIQNKQMPQTGPVPPKQPERHKPLSYANILRRLDSVPPMSTPPEPEKRRHSVKPCSHVTIAASPRVPPTLVAPSTPPESPIAAIRSARTTKQSKADSEQPNTVTAAIKLKIDLPVNKTVSVNNDQDNIKEINKSDENLKERTNDKCNETMIVSINGQNKQDSENDNETRNLVNQETQFQTQIAELSERLRIRDVETSELRLQMEKLEQNIYVKSSSVDRLQAELTDAYKDSEFLRQKLKQLQEEVQQYKQKNAEMVEEIQKKTDEYKTLEASSKERTIQLETSVKDLTDKLSNLESQITQIKEERDKLETRRAELETEREEEKKIVQEALEAATSENETIRRRWEQDFEKLRTVNTDREQQMLDDFEWKLREVQAACKKRLDEKDKLLEQRIKETQKDVDTKIQMAEEQMNEVKHLKSYEAEVTQLRGLTHDQQRSLKTMSERVDELQASEQNLRDEINRLLDSIEKEKRDQQLLVVRHEMALADKERNLQIRLEKQRGEVAVQWEQKLRQECARLTTELEQMHSDEKQLAVELVRVQKDSEYETVKVQLEKKIEKQLTEINELKLTLNKKENKFQNELERLQTNTDRDIMELRRELDKAEMSYHERTEKMLENHEKEIDRINEEAEHKLKELEQNCQMQLSSMRTTLELVKEQAARESEEKIERLQEEHRLTTDELWKRLTDEKEKEIEQIEQNFKTKFEKIKEQFTIVQKSHHNKETELLTQIECLKNEINDKTASMKSLQGNVDTLHGGVQVLRQEIVHQDQALNKAKIDAEQKIGELQHALKVERDTLQVEREEHMEEIAHLQNQSKSQLEQLQRRCQCLTKLFEDMRSRYDKRESRAEDLNLISDLRTVIAEQERDLAVLNEEKRYFQMKLIKLNNTEEGTPINNEEWKGGEKSTENSTSDSMESIIEENEDEVESEYESETAEIPG